MKKNAVLLAISLIASTPAIASEWVQIDLSEDPVVSVDKSSISFDKNIVKAWTKFEYAAPRKTASGKEYASAKSLYKYNCSNKTSANVAYTVYNNFEVVESYTATPKEIIYEDIIPDSFGDSIITYICSLKRNNK